MKVTVPVGKPRSYMLILAPGRILFAGSGFAIGPGARNFRDARRYEEDRPIPVKCEHIDQIREVTPSGEGCQECIDMGDFWVHLRLCLTCGQVGCCESSKNTHALKHSHASGHPIVESFEPGESWRWCYPDSIFIG